MNINLFAVFLVILVFSMHIAIADETEAKDTTPTDITQTTADAEKLTGTAKALASGKAPEKSSREEALKKIMEKKDILRTARTEAKKEVKAVKKEAKKDIKEVKKETKEKVKEVKKEVKTAKEKNEEKKSLKEAAKNKIKEIQTAAKEKAKSLWQSLKPNKK